MQKAEGQKAEGQKAERQKAQDPKADGQKTDAPKTGSSGVAVALELGWTMALLFGEARAAVAGSSDRLPTEHELPPDQRTWLEVRRVNALLDQLGKLLPKPASYAFALPQIPDSPSHAQLQTVNLDILTWLATADRAFGLAYQLGRSLRDTANPPLRTIQVAAAGDTTADWAAAAQDAIAEFANTARDTGATPSKTTRNRSAMVFQQAKLTPAELQQSKAQKETLTPGQQQSAQKRLEDASRPLAQLDAVRSQLTRSRVTMLQEWLTALGPQLPDNSAAIVSASIGRWCDLVTTIYDPDSPGRLRGSKVPLLPGQQDLTKGALSYPSGVDVAQELYNGLLVQGDTWLNLLIGAELTQGLLTPEGYVAAGEAALGRSARIIRRIAVHYWFPLVLVAAALGGVIFLAVNDLNGASKVWTQIAAVASALGVTSKGIGSRAAKLSEGAGASVFSAEKTDAMAWAITYIPAELKLDRPGVRALRRSGITASAPLGRV
ncbi:MAG TPA: hypothetical protein VGH27_08240 [Streptosporangiaceae bacterium]